DCSNMARMLRVAHHVLQCLDRFGCTNAQHLAALLGNSRDHTIIAHQSPGDVSKAVGIGIWIAKACLACGCSRRCVIVLCVVAAGFEQIEFNECPPPIIRQTFHCRPQLTPGLLTTRGERQCSSVPPRAPVGPFWRQQFGALVEQPQDRQACQGGTRQAGSLGKLIKLPPTIGRQSNLESGFVSHTGRCTAGYRTNPTHPRTSAPTPSLCVSPPAGCCPFSFSGSGARKRGHPTKAPPRISHQRPSLDDADSALPQPIAE